MRLIAGLGNPGKKYDKTKHDTGFMYLDSCMAKNNLGLNRSKSEDLFTREKIAGKDVTLLKPQTYMDESGRSIRQVANFSKIGPSDILTIQDDMNMLIDRTRIRANGKSGGHNGIKSIIHDSGTEKSNRSRTGTRHPESTTVVSWVLAPLDSEQQKLVNAAFSTGENTLTDFTSGKDVGYLVDKYN